MILFVFEDEYVKCELDDKLPVLLHTWKKDPPGNIFRDTLVKIQQHYIEFSKNYSNLAWLADTQLLGEVDSETEKWFEEVWDDMLFIKAKVKIHAVILGDDLFDEYPMEKFKLDAEEKFKHHEIQLGVFTDKEEAYDWIRAR